MGHSYSTSSTLPDLSTSEGGEPLLQAASQPPTHPRTVEDGRWGLGVRNRPRRRRGGGAKKRMKTRRQIRFFSQFPLPERFTTHSFSNMPARHWAPAADKC